ncbi:hypothetical protein [Candidatus Enterococcus mansonii]|uniref:DUF4369 domain-containing protein n=1 Tax=Candidatus Enterococcus mansonii TaxID=1834181 RepID=A0A242C6U0_9ENTE|nr:hypothetical protein [Enterococcus sp. 4G2_DIV0659]OTO05512.1 hypothetical protein A5880_002685 [Enterococcus sp. 4G2_DIV0659]
MKKKVLLTVGLSILLLAGCNSAKKVETSKSSDSKVSTKISSTAKEESKNEPKSTDILAKGTYVVGTDINPGTYFFVLTELNHGEKDTDKNGYVSIEVSGQKYAFETFKDVNAKKRFKLEDGDEVRFDDNYSPKSWTVRLLTDSDFKAYMGGDSAETTNSSTKESTASSSKTETKTSETAATTAFKPTDVSDDTIKSIKTYEDYLNMYQAIISNYLADYENAIKDTVLYDQAAFEEQKKQYEKSLEEQKKQYGDYGNKKLIGKDSLVEFLISYRDSLSETTNNLKKSLQ